MYRKLKYVLISILLFVNTTNLSAQGLLDELEELAKDQNQIDYTYATFKSSRVINGQSIENIPAKELNFIIGHRFGPLNGGPYQLFGLDQAQIRFALAYSFNDRFMMELGRSNFQKVYDLNAKMKILRQSTGAKNMPISASYYFSTAVSTLRWIDPNRENLFTSRLSYVHQILLARKFNSDFSFQLSPTAVHKNLVELNSDPNTTYALGFAGRYKLSNRVALNIEYYAIMNPTVSQNYYHPLSIGFDIETGGHVFQFHITNSMGLFDRNFIAETTGDWRKGDILFGFNINRVFTPKSKHS
jgi:hypothetical protein